MDWQVQTGGNQQLGVRSLLVGAEMGSVGADPAPYLPQTIQQPEGGCKCWRNSSSSGYNAPAFKPQPVRLANPTPVRLSPNLLQWLDSWRGDAMSRGTAIRILLQQSMELHRDGILPATKR
jgi:hypothetical protein